MTDYPQHDKLTALAGANQVVGDFIEWLGQNGMAICTRHKPTSDSTAPSVTAGHRVTICRHSLIGFYLMWEPPDRSFWTLGVFRAQLSEWVFLVEPMRPADGEPTRSGQYIVNLHDITAEDAEEAANSRAQIFADWAAVQRYVAMMDEPAAEKVVRLVREEAP